jgi:macrolide transport system ATP-binding/permease protein
MTSFWQDIQYSLRMIAKAPGFAAIAILTLALGIGANTTIFSWINATLLNPIPGVANASDVVELSLGRSADSPFPFTYPDFEMIRNGQQSFVGLTGCNPTPMSLTGKGKPERVWGSLASANYFEVLGVRPILGRGFLPEEDQKPGRRASGGDQLPALADALWREPGRGGTDD